MENYFGGMLLVKVLFQRSLALVYFIAFLNALNQFPVLLGEKGLLPVPEFLRRVSFREAPSLFHLHYSDRFLRWVAWAGMLLSLLAVSGILEKAPLHVNVFLWLDLWILYLSVVNVGQTFYAFGWESMLLEAGFFSAFLGTGKLAVSLIPILILRWMLFRVELGAGLIKIRGDECWHNLTCLFYHFETQPMPNPLSWYFHHFSKGSLKAGVIISHLTQLIAPIGLLGPQWVTLVAGAFIILHQGILLISGNYSWLNLLTVVLGITALSDEWISSVFPVNLTQVLKRPLVWEGVLSILALLTIALSIKPFLNLISKGQIMNTSYNPLHLVNSYGAFGAVTRDRYEIVLEGTLDLRITPGTLWKEYEFKGKPGDPGRMPPQIAPYHLRLDWLIWFLPFSTHVSGKKVYVYGYDRWFLRLVRKLLEGDPHTQRLFKSVPFRGSSPSFLRARYYHYQFTNHSERKITGNWWKRTLIGDYLTPVRLSELSGL